MGSPAEVPSPMTPAPPPPPPPDPGPGDVTQLLGRWGSGDDGAFERLAERVSGELRKVAGGMFDRAGAGSTLQPTAVVNEAFLKLIDKRDVAWSDRQHFLAFASKVMRDLLVDHERARRARKRGGDRQRVTLDERLEDDGGIDVDLLDLDAALTELAQLSARQAQLVTLRYFGGLEVEEAAEALGVSKTTAERDWRLSRAWLGRALEEKGRGE